MINISGYIRTDDAYLVNKDRLLSVNSVGYYKFKTRNIGLTLRSHGREDYQIIYIAKGKGYFVLDGRERTVHEGNIIIYRPGECQQYSYSYKDQSEIYWIHFTGSQVEYYLEKFNLNKGMVYEVGFDNEYISLWNRIITEVQVKKAYYEDVLEGAMIELIGNLARGIYEEKEYVSTSHQCIQHVIQEMHQNSEAPLTIREYAKQCNMSVCWFINSFKTLTGMTPQQYILHIKISKAKDLLTDTGLNIGEVSELVGFQNPLYFSRVFKKVTGICPREWKK